MQSSFLSNYGYDIIPGVLNDAQTEELRRELGHMEGAGTRGLLAHPLVRQVATQGAVSNLMRLTLGPEARPVRAIFFDKRPDSNWLVAWHQDLTIAVLEKHELADFGPWSKKHGIEHVQPPTSILERMLTIRLHLDDCDESNGALQVIPGSHRYGRFSAEAIAHQVRTVGPELCSAKAGDALLMRPLSLHSSRRSISDHPRRVLHIEFSGTDLPEPLQWHPEA